MAVAVETPPEDDAHESSEPKLFAGGHHARFLPDDVPLHIISRVFQGRHLLRPSARLNRVIVGVVGRARRIYPDVRLYALAFMSNHAHLLVQGPTNRVPAFIGYIKREISRRWGGEPDVDWPGTMWHEYLATALPTHESQERCLEYILGQGVKEGLVARAQQWPGVHAARALLLGGKLRGEWLDATAYARARDAQARRRQGRVVRRADFIEAVELELDPLPGWSDLAAEERRAKVRAMLDRIEKQGQELRAGRRPLGARAVQKTPRHRRTRLPKLPWFEARRRMICWDDPRLPEVRDYLDRYWSFQRAFVDASERFRAGDKDADFPAGAFRPGSYHPHAPPS